MDRFGHGSRKEEVRCGAVWWVGMSITPDGAQLEPSASWVET